MQSMQDICEKMNLFIKCFSITPKIVIVAIIYLDRLVVRGGEEFCLTKSNIKLALLGCLAIACKFCDDRFESNSIFSAVAEVPKK